MEPFTQNAENANSGLKNIAAKYALHLDFADQLVSSDKPKVVIASPFRAWQSSMMRYVGCQGETVGCLMVSLDCRVAALLAMTRWGREWAGWFRPSFRIYSHNAVIASPLGRGNPVGLVAEYPDDAVIALCVRRIAVSGLLSSSR